MGIVFSTFQPKHYSKAPIHCLTVPVFYPECVSISMISWGLFLALSLHGHTQYMHVQMTQFKECRNLS